jgi:5-methylcytosine-specific restriction endonuclease McrA
MIHGFRRAYYAYLRSPEWRRLCQQVRWRSGGICERCVGAPMRETHHRTYARFGGRERLSDLLGLCRPCHRAVHLWRRQWRVLFLVAVAVGVIARAVFR